MSVEPIVNVEHKKTIKKLDVSAKSDLFLSFVSFNSFEIERKRRNSHNDRLSHNVCATNDSTMRKKKYTKRCVN